MNNETWGIKGSNYDGCNGWSHWICEELLFSTKEKAEEYIKNRWASNSFSRFEPILLEIK